MVKKFLRPAAGDDEQLPSDLRAPAALQMTVDYLFNELLANAPSLASVHHYIWDRTRAIRNDFSIQGMTKPNDVRIAIDCYERIARFHILSMHQLATPELPYPEFSFQQEQEQLDRTLLSLLQYYEDNRGRVELPNEAEFQAYSIIFNLRTPEMENRVQSWPQHVMLDSRVQKAIELYRAACNTADVQGSFGHAHHVIAQQHWMQFWRVVQSRQVSYLMACVAEKQFDRVRVTALKAIHRAYFAGRKADKNTDWTMEDVTLVLGFDDQSQAEDICTFHGFRIDVRGDGKAYLDLSSVPQTARFERYVRGQIFSETLVETKRCRRTLPAIVAGMSVQQARNAGMLEDEDEDEDIDAMATSGYNDGVSDHMDDGESLFVPDVQTKSSSGNGVRGNPSPFAGFGTPSVPRAETQSSINNAGHTPVFKFGAPSGASGVFGAPTARPRSPPKPATGAQTLSTSSTYTAPSKSLFDFSGKTNTVSPLGGTFGGAAPKASPFIDFKKPSSPTTTPSKFSFGLPPTSSSQEEAEVPSTLARKTEKPSDTTFSFSSLGTQATQLPSFTSAPQVIKTDQPSIQQYHRAPPVSKAATVETAPPSPFDSTFKASSAETNGQRQKTVLSSPVSSTPSASSTQAPDARPVTSATDSSFKPAAEEAWRKSIPKKHSSLSHSFTADEGSFKSGPSFTPAPRQHAQVASPGNLTRVHSSGSNVTQQQTQSPAITVQASKPGFSSVLDKLAEEFTLDSVNGLLKQFIEFRTGELITEVQEKIYAERVNKQADKFRRTSLATRYGKRWRAIWWHLRLVKKGKERRRRVRESRQEDMRRRESGASGSQYDGTSAQRSSKQASILGSRNETTPSRQEMVDSMFQQSLNGWKPKASATSSTDAMGGARRPTPADVDFANSNYEQRGHKRLKSTGRVDDDGEAVATPPRVLTREEEFKKRTSYLGFSLTPTEAVHVPITTRTNYFRLKAMGINPNKETWPSRGTKRQRSESFGSTQEAARIAKTASSPAATKEHRRESALVRPSSSLSSKSIDERMEEDEAIFARLRAAREALTAGAASYKEEVQKDELRRSRSSQSSNESPSMAQARADARLRASQKSVDDTYGRPQDVPAYRLRESKFVPKGHYSRAIEKARQFREARSRDNNRPESRLQEDSIETSQNDNPHAAQAVKMDLQPQTALQTRGESRTHDTASLQDVRASNSLHHIPQYQPPPSFKSFASTNNSNISSGFQSRFANNTIQPSQISDVLSHTFGRSQEPHEPRTNSYALPQQNSQMQTLSQSASDIVTLLSSDEEDEEEGHQAEVPLAEADAASEVDQHDMVDNNNIDPDLSAGFGHANPFAHLQDDDSGDGDQWDGVTEEDEVGPYAGEDEERQETTASADQSGEDEEDFDGDTEEFDEYDEEGDDEDGQFAQQGSATRDLPNGNSAIKAGTGQSAEDAFELSD